MNPLRWLYRPMIKIGNAKDAAPETQKPAEALPQTNPVTDTLRSCVKLGEAIDDLIRRPEVKMLLLRLYTVSIEELFEDLVRPRVKRSIVAVNLDVYFRNCNLRPSLALERLERLLSDGYVTTGQSGHDIQNLCSDLLTAHARLEQEGLNFTRDT